MDADGPDTKWVGTVPGQAVLKKRGCSDNGLQETWDWEESESLRVLLLNITE